MIEPGEAAGSDVCGFQRLFKDEPSEQYAENNVKSADGVLGEAKTIFYLSLFFSNNFTICRNLFFSAEFSELEANSVMYQKA